MSMCHYTYDGIDTDGTVYYRCDAHDDTQPSTFAHCANAPAGPDGRRLVEDDYVFPAAREAFQMYGKDYADYIEAHTLELVEKGYDVGRHDLGEALAGNDGD